MVDVLHFYYCVGSASSDKYDWDEDSAHFHLFILPGITSAKSFLLFEVLQDKGREHEQTDVTAWSSSNKSFHAWEHSNQYAMNVLFISC